MKIDYGEILLPPTSSRIGPIYARYGVCIITSPPSGGRRLPDSVRARIAEALSRFSVPWRGAALEREENGDEGRV